MKYILSVLTIISLTACSGGKENRGATTSILEKVIEKQTGQEVGLANVKTLEKSSAHVTFTVGDKQIQTADEKCTGAVVVSKDKDGLQIYFQITHESGKSYMAGLTHVSENFSLPLSGVFTKSNAYDGKNPTATLVAMTLSENGMGVLGVPFEGTLTVTELTLDKAIFNIDAKGGEPQDAENPDNWKPLKMTAQLDFPITQTVGIAKEKVFK